MKASRRDDNHEEGRTIMTDVWPDIPFEPWKDTAATLHRFTQIVGKIRLSRTPWVNHSWHVALYVTSRGLGTSPIPHGNESFEVDFDFISQRLRIQKSDGSERSLPLVPQSVADFYRRLFTSMDELGLDVTIDRMPNEIESAIPFDEDREHGSYDPDAVHRFFRALIQVDRVLKRFRSRYLGKASPVHFFWGSFDLAVTRFSGRPAPRHPGGIPNLPDWVTREAYSHEVSSCGFWPGGERFPKPVFYSYAHPEPEGFSQERVKPAAAFYGKEMSEFFLLYDDVRRAADPDRLLLDFLQSTYAAAADRGGWDRKALEAPDPWPPRG
jgi:Family of unknown function (DUF5996)